MKLRALDQIHVSSVKSDALAPNEEFTCGDAVGAELLKTHPDKFEQLPDDPAEKAEGEPQNKKAPDPANKAAPAKKAAAKKPAAKAS